MRTLALLLLLHAAAEQFDDKLPKELQRNKHFFAHRKQEMEEKRAARRSKDASVIGKHAHDPHAPAKKDPSARNAAKKIGKTGLRRSLRGAYRGLTF